MTLDKPYDYIIVGAGLVGLVTAVSLNKAGFKVAILEAKSIVYPPKISDRRAIALTDLSRRWLNVLGLWDPLERHANAIDVIHVSMQRRHASLQLKHPGGPMGHVVDYDLLQAAAYRAVQQAGIKLFENSAVTELLQHDDRVELTLNDASKLSSSYVLAADGAQSTVRQLLGIGVEVKGQDQVALLTQVHLKRHHNQVAYERFIKQGPMAMLPFGHKRVTCVWTGDRAWGQMVQSLSNQDLLAEIQSSFGYRLGKMVGVEAAVVFPVPYTMAKSQSQGRVLLIGNAAHSIHPIAAQGFNLSLMDVLVLTDLALSHPHDLWFEAYLKARQQDQRWIVGLTKRLLGIFSSDLPGVSAMAARALRIMGRSSVASNEFRDYMMGRRSSLPDRYQKLSRELASED